MKNSEFLKELSAKDAAALQTELNALLKEQFNLRMQRAMQQLTDVNKLKNVRRNIARVRTVMQQKAGA
jgi:large subunit ribosomal protein L29